MSLPVLECVKPGVRSGQILLAVDLTIAGQPEAVLAQIAQLGYSPTIRHVTYSSLSARPITLLFALPSMAK
ncbi:MAG TPA: hypothetical protein V6D18_19950 [Thermosynechococcaceae cyanobacterium]